MPSCCAGRAGAKYKIVSGYNGTTEIGLAMERGEVVGSCGWDWASVKAQRGDWLRDKKINVLLQIGLERNEELTKMGVPHVWDYVKNDTDREVVELVIGQQVFQRSYIAPPEIPAAPLGDPAHRLRRDHEGQQFLADADKLRIDISPLPGREGAGDRAEAARDAEGHRAGGAGGDPALTGTGIAIDSPNAYGSKSRKKMWNFDAGRAAADRLRSRSRRPRDAQDFYAGKTIDFIVGHYVGGGYDIYARAVARHFARHIPGQPGDRRAQHAGRGQRQGGMHITHTAPRTAP